MPEPEPDSLPDVVCALAFELGRSEARVVQLREALVDALIRIIFIDHPREPRDAAGEPDWSGVLILIDRTLNAPSRRSVE